jgi:AcrR family transcriptional regulator
MNTNQKTMQKEKSREAITASAATLLRRRGIRASSVMEVMKGAGLTVGGFYNHFGSKEELFVEAIRSTASATWQNLLNSAKGDSPRARTLSVIASISRASIGTPRKRVACYIVLFLRLRGRVSRIGVRLKRSWPASSTLSLG